MANKPDLIDRRKLVEDLERFKVSLADVFFGAIVDRVIEYVEKQPSCKAPSEEVVNCG